MSRSVERLSTRQYLDAARADVRRVERGVAWSSGSASGLASTLDGLVGRLVAFAGGVEARGTAPGDVALQRLIRHRASTTGCEMGRFGLGVTVLAEEVRAIDSASARVTSALLRVHHSGDAVTAADQRWISHAALGLLGLDKVTRLAGAVCDEVLGVAVNAEAACRMVGEPGSTLSPELAGAVAGLTEGRGSLLGLAQLFDAAGRILPPADAVPELSGLRPLPGSS